MFGSNKEVVAATFVAKDQASKTVKTLRGNIAALGSRAGGPLGGMIGGIMAIPGPALLAGAAIGGLTAFLGKAAMAAMDEEKNVAKMGAALEANVADWDGNTDAIERQIAQREKLAFSDDDLRDSLSQLVFVTKDVDRAMQGQSLAMDIARAKNMSLTDASILVGKVMGGNVAILKRYGIQIRKGADATEALGALQQQFGGQAAAYAETTAGSMESMQIALADVVEDIGKELLPTMKDLAIFIRDDLVPAIRSIGSALGDAGAAVDDFNTSWAPQKADVEKIKDSYLGSLPSRQDVEGRLAALRGIRFDSPFQEQLFSFDVGGVKTTWQHEISELEAYLRTTAFSDTGDVLWSTLSDNIRESAVQRGLAALIGAPIVTGIEGATPPVRAAVEELTARLHWMQMAYDADKAARAAMGNVADTIRGSKDVVRSAMDDLIFVMTHPLKRLKEISRIEGALAGKKLAAGLASSDPGTKAQAEYTRGVLVHQWELLTGQSYNAGQKAGNAFTRGWKSGMRISFGGILRDIAGGSMGGVGERHSGGPVSANTPYLVGKPGAEELFVPRQSGYIAPGVPTPSMSAPGVSLPPIIVNIDGRELFRIMDARQGQALAMSSRYAYERG